MIWWPFWSILVHFGAPHGQPHNPSPSNFYEVIKGKYHTHQELWNVTSPTLLAQFVQEILIKHGQFPLVRMDKSYHHLPCRKKSIFLKKRWGKYFIGAGSWLTRMPTKKKWGETVSDKPNNLAVPWVKIDKSYPHLPSSKKSIFLKKRYRKYFIEAGSWFSHMPPKKKWRETVSDKPNNLAVIWMACKGKRIWHNERSGKQTYSEDIMQFLKKYLFFTF